MPWYYSRSCGGAGAASASVVGLSGSVLVSSSPVGPGEGVGQGVEVAAGAGRRQATQRPHRPHRPKLGHEPDDGVDHEHDRDSRRFDDLPDQHTGHDDSSKQDDIRAANPVVEDLPARELLGLTQCVAAHLGPPAGSLVARQAPARLDLEHLEHLRQGQRMGLIDMPAWWPCPAVQSPGGASSPLRRGGGHDPTPPAAGGTGPVDISPRSLPPARERLAGGRGGGVAGDADLGDGAVVHRGDCQSPGLDIDHVPRLARQVAEG